MGAMLGTFSVIFECFLNWFFGSFFGRLSDIIFQGFGEDFEGCLCVFFVIFWVVLQVAKINENRALANTGALLLRFGLVEKT